MKLFIQKRQNKIIFNALINYFLPYDSVRRSIVKKGISKFKRIIKNNDINRIEIPLYTDLVINIDQCDVLMQVGNFESGGLENVVIELSSFLTKSDYKVGIVVLGIAGDAVQKAKNIGIPIVCTQYTPESYKKLIKKLAPKFVVAHYSFVGYDICNALGIDFIQVVHSIYMWFNSRQIHQFSDMAKNSTYVVCVSEEVQNYCINRLHSPDEKTIVIHNGVDVNSFINEKNEEDGKKLRIFHKVKENDFVFINVGAINHQKNQLGLLKAFRIVSGKHPNSKLFILGSCYEPLLFEEMNSFIKNYKLEEKVFYLGSVSNMDAYYKMADAFVSSSFFEGCSLALIEAIISNLPIITTAVGHSSSFSGTSGITLVKPVYDLIKYRGPIWQLHSNALFEELFSEKMLKTIENPIRPNFPLEKLKSLDSSTAFSEYVTLFKRIVQTKAV